MQYNTNKHIMISPSMLIQSVFSNWNPSIIFFILIEATQLKNIKIGGRVNKIADASILGLIFPVIDA